MTTQTCEVVSHMQVRVSALCRRNEKYTSFDRVLSTIRTVPCTPAAVRRLNGDQEARSVGLHPAGENRCVISSAPPPSLAWKSVKRAPFGALPSTYFPERAPPESGLYARSPTLQFLRARGTTNGVAGTLTTVERTCAESAPAVGRCGSECVCSAPGRADLRQVCLERAAVDEAVDVLDTTNLRKALAPGGESA